MIIYDIVEIAHNDWITIKLIKMNPNRNDKIAPQTKPVV